MITSLIRSWHHSNGAQLLLLLTILSCYLRSTAFCWQTPRSMQQVKGQPSRSAARFQVEGRWIVDEFRRVRIFHGFNSVVKGPPFIDHQIFNETRLELYRQWGFNAVRLGTMWAGAEPTGPGQFNETYIGLLETAVDRLGAHGIYSILDMHQDVMSTVFDSYDGVPRWLVDKLSPAQHSYPWPFQNKFEPQEWALGYLTQAVGTAFQQLYDNEAGARDAMTSFWTKIASVFVNHASILGYELINEPWAGDIYKDLRLLEPGRAGSHNLVPLYDQLNAAIRTVDARTPIFYEPVTWGVVFEGNVTGTGFSSVPGGPQFRNRSVLSYHYYCWILDPTTASKHYAIWKRIFCDKILSNKIMLTVLNEVDRLGGSSFLTEFGLCAPNGDPLSVNSIECRAELDLADRYLQSWTYWDSGFFNDSIGQPDGVDWNVVRAFSRVFARAISGTPISMNFDADDRLFRLEWNVDQSIEQPTEIFVPRLHYPTGFSVRVADGLSWTYSDPESLVLVVIDKSDQTMLPLTTAFVVIEPKSNDG